MHSSLPILERLFSLKGKCVLITGASSGIGQTLAVALAEAGAMVGVNGRDVERVEQTCSMVETVGGVAVPLAAELYEVETCRNLVKQAHEAFGRLDILINCAATNRRKPIKDITEEDYDHIMAINLRSVYFLSQAVHPIMRAQGGGKIIHVSSVNVLYALDTVSVYGASKGGMAQLTKVQAIEWAPDNIQVNAITPGFVYTPLSAGLWADPDKAIWFKKRIPVRRPAQPDELVGITLLLASDGSSYITGQNIVVDGGFTAGGSWHRDEAWTE